MSDKSSKTPGIFLITDGGRLRKEGRLGSVLKSLLEKERLLHGVLIREQVVGNDYAPASDQEVIDLVHLLQDSRKSNSVSIVVHSRPDLCDKSMADGVHLNSRTKDVLSKCSEELRKGFSAHNESDLQYAYGSGYQYAFLSPVFPPGSKPNLETQTLGEEGFNEIITSFRSKPENDSLNVYALGGISTRNLSKKLINGIEGVAMISEILRAHKPIQSLYELESLLTNL